jgi:hypothetical protein
VPGVHLNTTRGEFGLWRFSGFRAGSPLVPLAVTGYSRSVSNTLPVTNASYVTSLSGSDARPEHLFDSSTFTRALTFAGTTFVVPSRTGKTTLRFNKWPGSSGSGSLEATYTLLVGSHVRSVRGLTSGQLTLWSVETSTELIVRITTFNVAEFGSGTPVRSVDVAAVIDPVNPKRVIFTFTFPNFNGTLTYDPVIQLTSSSASSAVSGGGDTWSPGVAAAVAVPVSLAALAAIAALVAFLVWRHKGRLAAKPATPRRGSSLYAEFTMQHENNLFSAETPKKDAYELNRLNWSTV